MCDDLEKDEVLDGGSPGDWQEGRGAVRRFV